MKYRCVFKVNSVRKTEIVTASSMYDARQAVLRMYSRQQIVFESVVPL